MKIHQIVFHPVMFICYALLAINWTAYAANSYFKKQAQAQTLESQTSVTRDPKELAISEFEAGLRRGVVELRSSSDCRALDQMRAGGCSTLIQGTQNKCVPALVLSARDCLDQGRTLVDCQPALMLQGQRCGFRIGCEDVGGGTREVCDDLWRNRNNLDVDAGTSDPPGTVSL